MKKGEIERAIADYDLAIASDSRSADAYFNRGLARLMQGELAEAEADIARCRALGGTLKPEAAELMEEMKLRSKRKEHEQ